MKLVAVNVGYQHVPIFGGVYNQGQTIQLTEDQYAALPPAVLAQVHIVMSAPNGQVVVPPMTPTPPLPNDSFTADLISSMLTQEQVPVFLTWDGSDYQPADYKSSATRLKTFIGPTDPTTVGGVIVNTYDQWIRSN